MTEREPRGFPKILCAGIAAQDIIMRVEEFPAPGAKVRASEYIITGGGCAANASIAVARLGGRAAFAGPLGCSKDQASNRIAASLDAEDVDCRSIVRQEGATISVSVILLDEKGEKFIATVRGAKVDGVSPPDIDVLVDDVEVVLIDNHLPSFVTPVCRAAQARKIPIVIDLDLKTMIDDPLLRLGSHVIASAEALRATTGLADLGAGLARLAPAISGFLAVTDGPTGVFWLEDGILRHLPGFSVTAVDTLAAGDIFHAGFALGLAEGHDLVGTLRFASAAAALKCTRFGGAAGAPLRLEVDQFLKQWGNTESVVGG
jgi:sulfofructose kinase